jgi:hypothetical protein
MRTLWAGLAVVLLAGCAAPPAEQANPLFGLCPQWQQGPGQVAGSVALDAETNKSLEVAAPPSLYEGSRPFDLLRVRIDDIHVDGALRLRARNATQADLNLRDYRQEALPITPVVWFGAGAQEKDQSFDVFLTAVAHDDPARPGPVELEWSMPGGGVATVAYTLTFHYKVCGAEVP